jgi:uncharacterized phage-associated protein
MFESDETLTFSHDLDVRLVADYFIQQDALREEPDVTPMKLQKLLYFAQANYLASTGERLFNENVEAYEHGPVVHREWQRHPGRQIIAAESQANFASDDVVPTDVESFLDQVWLRYKDCSATTLRNITHRQDPWRKNYSEGSYRPIIPDAEMAEYFRHRVPVSERVFHQSVVLIPEDFLGGVDDDSAADTLAAFLRQ